MRARPSSIALVLALALATAAAWTLAEHTLQQSAGAQARAERAARVVALGLTDFAWFSEARYTRHWSLADRHAPFQDHPLALEHFPAGSVLPAPESWR